MSIHSIIVADPKSLQKIAMVVVQGGNCHQLCKKNTKKNRETEAVVVFTVSVYRKLTRTTAMPIVAAGLETMSTMQITEKFPP